MINANLIISLIKNINPVKVWKVIRQTEKINALNNKITELMQKLAKLESPETMQQQLEFRDNIYYHKTTKEPFCPRCWDSDKKTIRLTEGGNPDYWHYKNCDNYYKKPGSRGFDRFSPPPPNMGYGF